MVRTPGTPGELRRRGRGLVYGQVVLNVIYVAVGTRYL